jgi:hypothetical protein
MARNDEAARRLRERLEYIWKNWDAVCPSHRVRWLYLGGYEVFRGVYYMQGTHVDGDIHNARARQERRIRQQQAKG